MTTRAIRMVDGHPEYEFMGQMRGFDIGLDEHSDKRAQDVCLPMLLA